MRLRVDPEDFVVEERIRLPVAGEGPFALYQVRKREITTLQAQARLATRLGIPRSDVNFPALKDRHSVAVQHASVRGTGPATLEGRDYQARFLGRAKRPLRPGDLQGNRFIVTLRDLHTTQVGRVRRRLAGLARFGLPNYFDRQRFGSYLVDTGDFPGKRILRRDVEGALRAYLCERQIGDPKSIDEFRSFAREHWGEWQLVFERAPRPSNFRSVLTFLRDHPSDFRKALNLVTPRVLSIWLAAYQSFLWNRIAGGYLSRRLAQSGVTHSSVEVLSQLPLYRQLPSELFDSLQQVSIPLVHQRVNFSDEAVAAEARAALLSEGLQVRDFKARVLKKAYLSKGERKLLVVPQDIAEVGEKADDRFQGRRKMRIEFTLPPGSYATLLLRGLSGPRGQRRDRSQRTGSGHRGADA